MRTKRILAFLLSTVLLFASLSSLFGVFGADASKYDYVQNGLVSWYRGDKNTQNGHNIDSKIWEDLVSGYNMTVSTNAKNYFTDVGLRVNSQKQNFPNEIVDLINGSQFTVEIELGTVKATGTNYNVLMNCSNDNFSLFHRVSEDVIEWKFGGGSTRPKISQGLRYMQNHLLAFTFEYGGSVVMYVDGVEMARANANLYMNANDLFIGHTRSDRISDITYKNIRFYSRSLAGAEVEQNALAAGYDPDAIRNFVDYVSVAQPKTNIVGDIAMVRSIDSMDELNKMIGAKSLPATAVYHIDKDLNVLDNNASPFTTVKDVFEKCENKIIQCFYINDNKTADSLADYLNSKYFFDVQIMSDDKNVLKYAHDKLPATYGILDLRTEYADARDLTKEQLLQICRDVNKYNAYVVALPVALCNNADVQYLFDRQVNVWAFGSDDPSLTEQYYALLSGAVGVVSDATESYIDIACNKLAENTITRVSANTGHRGIPSQAPECTVEGSALAYELGANVIEMDIYLTKDGHIVAMHDRTTGRTCNQDLVVEDCTLAQLKKLYVNKGFENDPKFSKCRIPTLNEYFEYFKDTECLFFIEIKTSKDVVVSKLKNLIDEYDMYGQCTVITSNHTILSKFRSEYPEMSLGFLNRNMIPDKNADKNVPSIMNVIGKYNATHNPYIGDCTLRDIRAFLIRGVSMYPWTMPEVAQKVANYYLGGAGSWTTDYPNILGETTNGVAFAEDLQFENGKSTQINLLATRYDKVTSVIPASNIVMLQGEAVIDQNSITPNGSGTYSFVTYNSFSLLDCDTYVLYTQPHTFTIEPEVNDVVNDSKKKSGCKSSVESTFVISASTVLMAFAMIKAKKSRDND